jgi:hypothetical protein
MLAEGAIDRAEIGQGLDIIGLGGDGALDERRRGFVIFASMRDQAKMMQAKKLIGLPGEDAAIDFLRFVVTFRPKIFESDDQVAGARRFIRRARSRGLFGRQLQFAPHRHHRQSLRPNVLGAQD